MPRFRNISPLGDLDLPLLGRIVEAGEEFELSEERAVFLEGQEAVWLPLDAAGETDLHVDELRQLLRDRGLSASGRKADLTARLDEALAAEASTNEPEGDQL